MTYNNRTYYRRFTWIGNKLTDEDMRELYALKVSTGKSITRLVAEAVRQYITRQKTQYHASTVTVVKEQKIRFHPPYGVR